MNGYQAALSELAALLASRRPHRQFLQQACDLIALHTSAAVAYIATIEPSTAEGTVIAVAGPARTVVQGRNFQVDEHEHAENGLAAQVYQANRSLTFNNLEKASEFSQGQELIREMGLGAAAGICLRSEGRCRAVLGLVAKDRKHFATDILSVAERLGDLLVTAIEHEDERKLRNRYTGFYTTLADLSDLMIHDCEPQTLYEETCRLIAKLSPDLSAAVVARDSETACYRLAAWSSNLVTEGDEKYLKSLCFSRDNGAAEGQGLVGEVLRSSHSVHWDERAILLSERPTPRRLHEMGSRAQLGTPIAVGGDLEGVLVLSANRPGYFTEEIRNLTERVAGNLGRGIQAHRQRLAIAHQAFIDTLTGLPNRSLLLDRLETAIAWASRDGTRLALALIDLDNLKEINDQFGHSVGDSLIRKIAQRLTERVRNADTVARSAGDEFAGVFSLGDRDEILELPAQRLLDAISEPLEVDGVSFQITAGIGFARYPDDARNAQDLMRRADLALHRAKRRGRNQWSLFEAETEAQLVLRRRTRDRFVKALSDGDMTFHYQPKVDMRTGKVFGAEALARWCSDGQKNMPPGQWLPVIETDTSLSAALGRHALHSVVEQLGRWHDKGLELVVSVNISARHLQMPGFVDDVRNAIRTSPNLASYLALEVTETTLVEDSKRLGEVLAACRQLGLKIALDDFGTGYASLSYLQTLPADVVKVDVDFVRNMPWDTRAFSIVAGTLQMAQMSGMEVVAEGVETEEHGKRLLQLGCPLAQGFGISPAMPADDFERWMKAWKPPDSWAKERPVTTTTMAHSLLATLVYHRARRRSITKSTGPKVKLPEARQIRCPLETGGDLRGIPEPLRLAHRELHEAETVALHGTEQRQPHALHNDGRLGQCSNSFERLVDLQLRSTV